MSFFKLCMIAVACLFFFLEQYVLMIIAKASYPNRFQDIKVNEWVLDFYQNVYGVDEETARGLRSAQWLDWMVEENF